MKYFLLLFLTLSACSNKTEQTLGCGSIVDQKGAPIRWQKPVVLNIHQSMPDHAVAQLYSAASVWNKALNMEIIKINWVKTRLPFGQDNTSIVYWVDNWSANPSAQALTSLYFNNYEILEGDIRVNATNYLITNFDLKSLFIHELGHLLSLKHQEDDITSVMYPYLGSNQIRREISKIDLNNIKCVYNQ